MAAASFRVVGIGAKTHDEFLVVPDFRAEEHVTQALARYTDIGGPVDTALAVLTAHGHDCTLIDAVGEPARAVILVRERDGARQIVFSPSSAPEPDFEPGALSGAHLLHINGRHENAARAAVRLAQVQNVEISFDGGAGRFRESIRDLFEASHLRIVSRDFAAKCSGSTDMAEIVAKLLRPPARLLVITDGTNGSDVWTPDGSHYHQPAFQAEPLVDTTGCGDVYHGAFLHGWLSDWSIERCAAYASMVAAKNAEGLGGRYVLNDGTLNLEV